MIYPLLSTVLLHCEVKPFSMLPVTVGGHGSLGLVRIILILKLYNTFSNTLLELLEGVRSLIVNSHRFTY